MTSLCCVLTHGFLDHYIICSRHTIFIKRRRSDVHFNGGKKKQKAGGWGGPSRHPVANWRWNISSRKSWLISHWALVSIATTPRSSVRMAWSWSKKNMQPHRHCHWPHFRLCLQVSGDPWPPCSPETCAHFPPKQEEHNQRSPLRLRLHCWCAQKEFLSQSNMSHPLSSVYYFDFSPFFFFISCSVYPHFHPNTLAYSTFGEY